MKVILRYSTLIFSVSIVILYVTTSCESAQRPEEIVGEIPEVVSFSEHIIPIFEGRSVGIELSGKGRACTDCHNGSTPPNLTVENAYIELTGGGFIDLDNPEKSRLYDKMAPGGSMNTYTNETDLAYILEWINQGALEN